MKPNIVIEGKHFFDEGTIPIYVDLFIHDNDVRFHSHPFVEFVYIVQGFSSHYYNNITTILTPGDMFGVRPGDVHGYTQPHQTKLYNCLFYPEAVESEMNEILKLPGIGWAFSKDYPSTWQRVHFNPLERKEAIGYLEKMKWELANRGTGWEVKMKSLLLEFLIAFSRTFENQYKGEERGEYQYIRYVYQAIGIMEKNFNRALHIDEMADTIGLSRDYFSRLFKSLTGLSPMEYLKNVRLAKAAELLQDPQITISQVAEKVGIDDPSYFTRQFRQALGISPSQYQNNFGFTVKSI